MVRSRTHVDFDIVRVPPGSRGAHSVSAERFEHWTTIQAEWSKMQHEIRRLAASSSDRRRAG